MPWWRQQLVDIGVRYLEWVLPQDQSFRFDFEPTEKSWSMQVLEQDVERRAHEQEGRPT